MQAPQSSDSPGKNCFCGCLASPGRDNKYCSEQCALEDTEKMLMGEPSHYRNVSQTETLERVVRSNSRCQVAERILAEANVACNTEYKQPNNPKPLPPLPPQPQPPTPRALVDIKNTLDSSKQEDTLLPRPLLKRLHSSILVRRVEERVAQPQL